MTADRLPDLKGAFDLLISRRVMVGIPGDKTDRKPDPHEPAGVTNAALGYIHEHGDPAQNIPARPFLGPGILNVQTTLADWLEKTAMAAVDGNVSAVDRGLHATGLAAQSGVRGKITAGPFEPLKPMTLAKRRERGRTGEKPLIDKGELRNSINYAIRKVT